MTQVKYAQRRVADHPAIAILSTLAILAAGAALMLVLGVGPAAGFHNDSGPCEAGDIPTGYSCEVLLNKGNGATVGELFFKKDGDNIVLVTNLFGLDDTGHDGEKLCLDDDDNPWAAGTSCLGGTAKTKLNSPYTLADLGTPDADGDDKYEFMIEGGGLGGEVDTCFTAGGAEVSCATPGAIGPFAKYTVLVDGYGFLSFHFNQQLSIESFFEPPRDTTLRIEKTPDSGTVDVGDKLSFDITVSDVSDGVDAINATVTDELPGDRDWTIVTEGPGTTPPTPPGSGTACSLIDSATDSDDDVDDLTCTFATLADGTSYSLTVETSAAVTSTDCDTTFNNTAFAEADNAPQVSDGGDITVDCTALQINKTPDSGTVTIGDKLSFDITVSDVSDGVDAINATVTDELPGDRDWTIVTEGPGTTPPTPPGSGTACSLIDSATDSDDDVDDLTCTFATLADGTSYSLTVETSAAVTSTDCDTTFNNTAFAEADNAPQVSDSGAITVECGAVEVTKVAKDATTSIVGDTVPVQGAGFTLYDSTGTTAVTGEVTTGTDGVACFDALPLNTQFTLRETTPPTGYFTVDDRLVTSSADGADCEGTGTPTALTVENTPKTDIEIDVTADVLDGTRSTIVCVDPGDDGTFDTLDDVSYSSGTPAGTFEDPASLDINDLPPGEYRCTIVIDP